MCIKTFTLDEPKLSTPDQKARGLYKIVYALPIFATDESLDSKSTLSGLEESRKPG